ncbi:hypothetical protein [Polynucleobacter sp. MWH-S4W17]|uniref:hypothetical protein n=1 Tax=Polynucleobacter sp. MWH-S4W17 TaxID=1855910 RepID=UPI001BFEAD4C|nr:hypothetical protein [Polynucleobacter sp. MWH-S4W17]QWD81745.1 hypothetical protein C2755_00730 [Polynucleobacter sp. MWH-S4W17]
MSSIVLITTANTPPKNVPFLKMTNAAARLLTAKAAAFFWAAHGIKKIVIADATGGQLLTNEEIVLLKQMDVDVELIAYTQDDNLVKAKGKGYGEGLLIQFALNNSNFLKTANNFFKCTGKVYCRNFETIFELIMQNNIQNIFWRYLGEGDGLQAWADMRFFYTSRRFCEEILVPAYLGSDDSKTCVEHLSFIALNENVPQAKALRPLLSGFAGYTGKPYFDSGLGFLDTNYPCWVGV